VQSTEKNTEQNYDVELLYVSALIHGLGLTKKFSSLNLRFEVDGANAVRSFLQHYQIPDESIHLVWDAIAEHKETEVALLFSGVGLDGMGEGFE